MFEFFFKYPAALYQQGTLLLGYTWIGYALTVAAALVAALALAGYLHRFASLRPADRLLLTGLRSAWVALLVLALCQPLLLVTVPVTLRGDVVVLLDDSQSMRIDDAAGDGRGATLQRLFAPDNGEVSLALAERFPLHHVAFGLTAQPVDTGASLEFDSPRSDFANALEHARTQLQGTTPGAVVLVSDGGAEPGAALQDEMLAYRAAGIPVHTVGIGAARFDLDLEVTAVSLPPRVFPGDMLNAEVTLRQSGAAGRQVILQTAEEGILLDRQPVVVPATDSFTVPVVVGPMTEAGMRRVSFTITSQPDEQIIANNRRDALVQVVSDPVRVLHFEGEPRFEVKFVRRAVSDDESIDLISLIRTAENKYYRVGVANPEQLADGFPDAAQALFEFDVVVLGSVDANLLSESQQQLLIDYVARRGGALLLLGARRSFAEGGYSTSELGALLPVRLRDKQSEFRQSVVVSPTSNGLLHPVVQALLRVAPDDALEQLPPLTMVNPLQAVKPGATVLLQGSGAESAPFVVLAFQRYGRGTVAVMSARDTWRWQMHSSVASDDLTHETLWRELLRWLARPVPQRIELRTEPRRPVPGEQVRVTVDAVDAAFQPLAAAELSLMVTTPLGDQRTYPLSRSAGESGLYSAEFAVSEPGLYELQATLAQEPSPVVGDAAIEVFASGDEYRAAELDESLLRHIAEATGGGYFTAADATGLDSVIEEIQGDASSEQRLPLHDVPALLLIIVLLICGEWFYRRRRGLA
ncbi:MAG: glutamine amidotransferase [Gammaproteobacteria bacterium]|nr:glutamine amidotransferase [Gammaproteobacteria bacterium]